MRRLWTPLAIAMVLALSPASIAMAADLFSTFKSACLDTRGEMKPALAVVGAAGWKVVPVGALPTDNMGVKLKDVVARGIGEGSGQRVMLVGDGMVNLAGRGGSRPGMLHGRRRRRDGGGSGENGARHGAGEDDERAQRRGGLRANDHIDLRLSGDTRRPRGGAPNGTG
jgi:hypothetical protein